MQARYFALFAYSIVVYLIHTVSTYGAAGPVLDKTKPALAHDPQNNRYLAAYEKDVHING
jgi:hypothetical protein